MNTLIRIDFPGVPDGTRALRITDAIDANLISRLSGVATIGPKSPAQTGRKRVDPERVDAILASEVLGQQTQTDSLRLVGFVGSTPTGSSNDLLLPIVASSAINRTLRYVVSGAL